jgi:hypothetical protein
MRKVIFKRPYREKVSIKAALREELGWVIDGAEQKAKAVIKSYPWVVYSCMVALIIISFTLRFLVLGPVGKNQKHEALNPAISKFQKKSLEGMPAAPIDQLTQMRKLITLRAQMDSVMQKGKLTREDSLFIINAGETIKKITNEKN